MLRRAQNFTPKGGGPGGRRAEGPQPSNAAWEQRRGTRRSVVLSTEPEAVKNYLILIRQLTAYSPPGEGLKLRGVRTFPAQACAWTNTGQRDGSTEGWKDHLKDGGE